MDFYEFAKELKSFGFGERTFYSSSSSDFKYIYKTVNDGKTEEIQISSNGSTYQVYRRINVGHYRIIFNSSIHEEILKKVKREIKIIKLKTIIDDDLV